MYKVIICDDDMTFANTLEDYILEYAKKSNNDIDVQVYSSGEELFANEDKEEYTDLIFLDIELGMMNGVEVGTRIRKELHNESIQIVYVSSKEGYAMQLFNLRPMNFLIKPIDYAKTAHILDEYIRLYGTQHFIEYQIGKKICHINEKSILYLQSIGKKIKLTLANGEIEFYGKLSNIIAKLNQDSFCSTHKSYVINMQYVVAFRPEEVEMTNGDVVPISRSMKKSVNERILKKKIEERMK